MKRSMLVGMLGLLTLTSCTTTHMLSEKSEQDQKRDAVECQGDARQGAGDGYGLVHTLEVNRLLRMCLDERGKVAQR